MDDNRLYQTVLEAVNEALGNQHEWLRKYEAIKHAHVANNTFDKWIKNGGIHARYIEGVQLYDKREIDEFINSHQIKEVV